MAVITRNDLETICKRACSFTNEYQGMTFDSVNGKLVVVSTDGHRLDLLHTNVDFLENEKSYMHSCFFKQIHDIVKSLYSKDNACLEFGIKHENNFVFYLSGTMLHSEQFSIKYVIKDTGNEKPVSRMLEYFAPKNHDHTTFSVRGKFYKVLSDHKHFDAVVLKAKNDTLTLTFKKYDSAQVIETEDIVEFPVSDFSENKDLDKNNEDIAVNVQYLLDIFKLLKKEEKISMSYRDNMSNLSIGVSGEWIHFIMPMRK